MLCYSNLIICKPLDSFSFFALFLFFLLTFSFLFCFLNLSSHCLYHACHTFDLIMVSFSSFLFNFRFLFNVLSFSFRVFIFLINLFAFNITSMSLNYSNMPRESLLALTSCSDYLFKAFCDFFEIAAVIFLLLSNS